MDDLPKPYIEITSDEQRKALQEFKDRLLAHSDERLQRYPRDDQKCLRFLKSRKYKVDESVALAEEHVVSCHREAVIRARAGETERGEREREREKTSRQSSLSSLVCECLHSSCVMCDAGDQKWIREYRPDELKPETFEYQRRQRKAGLDC